MRQLRVRLHSWTCTNVPAQAKTHEDAERNSKWQLKPQRADNVTISNISQYNHQQKLEASHPTAFQQDTRQHIQSI